MPNIIEGDDFYYIEGGRKVLTELFHLRRGSCCGNGCRHCPYIPKYTKGNTNTYKNEEDNKIGGSP